MDIGAPLTSKLRGRLVRIATAPEGFDLGENEGLARYNTVDESVLDSLRQAFFRAQTCTSPADSCSRVRKDFDQKSTNSDTPSTGSTRCTGNFNNTEAVLDTLVGCIEELQTHVSFLFTQIASLQANAEAKIVAQPDQPIKRHNRVRRKARGLRRQAWEIKQLEATVRILHARQRATDKQTRPFASKCSKQQHLVKAKIANTTACALLQRDAAGSLHINSVRNSSPKKTLMQAIADSDKTDKQSNGVADPASSTTHGALCWREPGALPLEASMDTQTTFMSEYEAAVPLPRIPSLAGASCFFQARGGMALRGERSGALLSPHRHRCGLDREVTGTLSDFGDIPREITLLRDGSSSALPLSARRSDHHPGRMCTQATSHI